MELLLIRHGLPELVINKGQAANPPLTDEGQRQAKLMAGWLQEEPLDRIYASPMQRAKQTALPLAEMHSMPAELHDGVAEFDRDSDTYIPAELLKEQDYERWKKLMRTEDDAGFQEFAETVIQALTEITEGNRSKRVAVVCHGGVINVWTAHVLGFAPRMFFIPDYTSISRFRIAGTGEKTVVTLNEQAHLRRFSQSSWGAK